VLPKTKNSTDAQWNTIQHLKRRKFKSGSIIPAHGRLRQNSHEFKASPGKVSKTLFKNKKLFPINVFNYSLSICNTNLWKFRNIAKHVPHLPYNLETNSGNMSVFFFFFLVVLGVGFMASHASRPFDLVIFGIGPPLYI
jgi:hypothetical protein